MCAYRSFPAPLHHEEISQNPQKSGKLYTLFLRSTLRRRKRLYIYWDLMICLSLVSSSKGCKEMDFTALAET